MPPPWNPPPHPGPLRPRGRRGRSRRKNAMHVMYFTEQPMSAYPADIGLEAGHTALMFSNKHFDPVAGSELYNRYLEHYIYAEEQGVEGFMLNEHHNAPFCMQAKCNIFASILAAVTKKAKIVLLGNPLPLAENPVRLAEELAMIDMISKGRLVSGFVRGGGQAQLANGVNPAYNALNTSIEATKNIWKIYDAVALEAGYEAGPENRGYLQQVHVSDSEEKAEKNARQFLWMQGEFTGLAHPVWSAPSGYFSPEHRRQFVEFAVGRAESPRGRPTFEKQVADGRVIYGTPDTVIPKLRHVLEETRPSIYGLWGNDGSVSNEDARTCLRLLGQEAMPAMREIGKELGRKDPVEANAPVHLRYSTDLKQMPQAAE